MLLTSRKKSYNKIDLDQLLLKYGRTFLLADKQLSDPVKIQLDTYKKDYYYEKSCIHVKK